MSTHAAVNAVVVGGSGFLGRHICAALVADGARVLSVARHPAPGTACAQIDLVEEEPAILADVLVDHGATVLVNAAGAVWEYDESALEQSNVLLVRRLRDAVAKVPHRVRVVQLGSVFEYAMPAPGRHLTEDAPPTPSTAYGRSKLKGSEVVLEATRAGLLDGVVLRATSCAGPGLPRSSLLGRVAAQLRDAAGRGEPAVIRLAPLTAERDFVDCRDLAAAVAAAATAPVVGRTVNIGSGTAVSVRRLVDLLVSVSGVPATVVEEGSSTGRSAGVDWLAVHPGLAGRLLGWRPRHSLASTVRAMWSEAITNAEEGPD
ncbi:NAD-dependent epimerase/dehydratase family protein [Streptomyces sp. NBC_00258]|uniref:NAD-dependent epimerase/dehydratase family protein n=1 Tax=Streptomyces sp. NBC_00258 TaxID=2903642 RepID=UPI002E285105|nr:NAD(P)-dependent oxidoreductase [Streptomyces sp. NBC_00258]